MKPGEIIRVIKGEEKVAVLSNSAIIGEALSQIKNKSLGYSLYSCPFIGLIDKDQLKKIFNHYERIITFEDHQRSGGFGSYILEEANDLFLDKENKKFPVLERKAVPDVIQSVSGSQEFLRELSKLELN